MARKNNDYFKMLTEMVGYSCTCAKSLNRILSNFNVKSLSADLAELHQIEHAADIAKHDLMNTLVKEFITPIEREDIMSLAQLIDSVSDRIEDVLIKIYMYNIQVIRPEAFQFTAVIENCCEALKTAMGEMHNFKKSQKLHECIVEVNRLEEVGDKLYLELMHNLYAESKDAVEIMVWTETFDNLEKCCDTCEHVADIIETVIMKNS